MVCVKGKGSLAGKIFGNEKTICRNYQTVTPLLPEALS